MAGKVDEGRVEGKEERHDEEGNSILVSVFFFRTLDGLRACLGLVDLAASVHLRLFAALLSKGGPDRIFSLPAPRRKSQHRPTAHHFNTSFDSSQRADSRTPPSTLFALHSISPVDTFVTELTVYPICSCGIRYLSSLLARGSIALPGIFRSGKLQQRPQRFMYHHAQLYFFYYSYPIRAR